MSPILGIWASQNYPRSTTAFESIATATVSSASTITFSSIPQTYKHLQIRGIAHATSPTGNDDEWLYILLNGNTSTYSHLLYGTGSAAGSSSYANDSKISVSVVQGSRTAQMFGATIIDILDYSTTSKNKTVRALGGKDLNATGGYINLGSSFYNSTSAITSITLQTDTGAFGSGTTFALYGIKG